VPGPSTLLGIAPPCAALGRCIGVGKCEHDANFPSAGVGAILRGSLQLLEIGDLEDAVEDAVRSRLGLGGLHQFAKAVGPLTNYVNPTRRARSGNHIHTVCHPTHCARSLQLLEC
jgi:hypothetical protein